MKVAALADRLRRLGGRWGLAGWTALAVSLAGAAVFLHVVNAHYPIEKWLFWIYAEVWAFTLIFGAACLAAGELVVGRFLRFRAPLRERLLISFAVGVFVFATGVFVAGLCHALGAAFFVAWPAVLIAAAARPLVRTWRRVRRLLPHARRVATPASWWGGVALVFGLAGIALVYVNILTPANVAYDARWYHLAIAEHTAAAGAIARSPEGWFNASLPHLASLLYTWAFLIPHGGLYYLIELAAHLELILFLATLAGVSMLARWAVAAAGPGRVRNAWAALFLFPGVLLYDSSLSGAADHALAFWAPFILLVLRRTLKSWDVPGAILLALMMAGAILTKYQALYLLLVPGAAMLARAATLARATWKRSRGPAGSSARPARERLAAAARSFTPIAAWAAGGLVFTTSLWLTNWIWYGDPVYPMLPHLFNAHPWVLGTDPDKFLQIAAWTPQGTLPARLEETLKATLTFSFIPHDWWNLHGSVPVFGSLFTLGLPLALFVKPRRRLWALGATTMVGIACWYWTYHQDRYLQALLPWMAAFVGALLPLLWRLGRPARAGVVLLVGAQVVWGGDVFAFPTHAMLGQAPMKVALDLISSGYRKDWAPRATASQELESVGRLLPPRAKVLIHERLPHLGVEAMSVSDAPGTQGGISYGLLATPRRVYDLLASYGVTHVLWQAGATLGWDTFAGDLVFFEFVERATINRVQTAGLELAQLSPKRPPDVAEPRLVRLHACDGAKTIPLANLDAALAGAAVSPVDDPGHPPAFLVVQTGCAAVPPESTAAYKMIATRGPYQLWIATAP